ELGPRDGAQLAPQRRAEVADYLLAQQSASERAATREFLEGSAAGRAWARVVAGELRPLAGDALPAVPAEGAEVEEAFDAPQGSGSKALGVLYILRQDGARLLAVQAQGMQPTTRSRFYAVWLTGGGQPPRPLGFTPPVTASGKDHGRLAFANPLPDGAQVYKTFLITAE